MKKLLRYLLELILFLTFYVVIFALYLMRTDPTEFIYYNF